MHQKTMDNRPHTPENICYVLVTTLFNVLMLLFIICRDALASIDWSWACTQFTHFLCYITPLCAGALFHLIQKIIGVMCVHFLPLVLTTCVFYGILAYTFPALFWGLYKVLSDWFVALKKADDVIEDLDKDYPHITYAICTFVAVVIVAIFLCHCLKCATDKTENMHTENNTTVNNAGDSNVHNNIQNTRVNDRRNFQINIKCHSLQLPLQLIDSQIEARTPTSRSPRKCNDLQLSPQQMKANGKARKSPRQTICV